MSEISLLEQQRRGDGGERSSPPLRLKMGRCSQRIIEKAPDGGVEHLAAQADISRYPGRIGPPADPFIGASALARSPLLSSRMASEECSYYSITINNCWRKLSFSWSRYRMNGAGGAPQRSSGLRQFEFLRRQRFRNTELARSPSGLI